MIADRILADIDAAAKRRDFASCQTSIETLIELWQDADEPRLPAAAAVPVAKALRGQRQFKSVIALSEAWQHLPLQDDPPAQDLFLYRSQALIEEGLLDQAIDEMRARINDFAPGGHQHAEAWGRLGRAFKQRYVDAKGAGDCATLLQAIGAYAEIARRNGNEETDLTRYHWHEVNLIALTARAEMDGCDPGHDLDSATWARGLADRLEANIDTSPRDLMWKLASLGECYVAMAQYARAGEIYRRYLAHPGMELFECTSSLRQLEEVWRLGGSSGTPDNPEAAALLKALRERVDALAAERLDGDTAASTIGLTAAESSRLERFDRSAPATSSARLPSRPIELHPHSHHGPPTAGRRTLIRDRLDHWIYGTGFFVRGSELAPWLGDDAYMLTTAHVLGRTDARALRIDDAMLDILGREHRPDASLPPRSRQDRLGIARARRNAHTPRRRTDIDRVHANRRPRRHGAHIGRVARSPPALHFRRRHARPTVRNRLHPMHNRGHRLAITRAWRSRLHLSSLPHRAGQLRQPDSRSRLQRRRPAPRRRLRGQDPHRPAPAQWLHPQRLPAEEAVSLSPSSRHWRHPATTSNRRQNHVL